MTSIDAWVDTGFFVALFAQNNRYHASAVQCLSDASTIEMHSLWPVVAEACFFLDTKGKAALLEWLERGAVALHGLALADLPLIRGTLEKYSDLSPDFTDAALVTLAGHYQINRIVTVDRRCQRNMSRYMPKL